MAKLFFLAPFTIWDLSNWSFPFISIRWQFSGASPLWIRDGRDCQIPRGKYTTSDNVSVDSHFLYFTRLRPALFGSYSDSAKELQIHPYLFPITWNDSNIWNTYPNVAADSIRRVPEQFLAAWRFNLRTEQGQDSEFFLTERPESLLSTSPRPCSASTAHRRDKPLMWTRPTTSLHLTLRWWKSMSSQPSLFFFLFSNFLKCLFHLALPSCVLKMN